MKTWFLKRSAFNTSRFASRKYSSPVQSWDFGAEGICSVSISFTFGIPTVLIWQSETIGKNRYNSVTSCNWRIKQAQIAFVLGKVLKVYRSTLAAGRNLSATSLTCFKVDSRHSCRKHFLWSGFERVVKGCGRCDQVRSKPYVLYYHKTNTHHSQQR